MYHDTVNMNHDVITANPFPYIAKFMFVSVGNNKTQQINSLNLIRYFSYTATLYMYSLFLSGLTM